MIHIKNYIFYIKDGMMISLDCRHVSKWCLQLTSPAKYCGIHRKKSCNILVFYLKFCNTKYIAGLNLLM